MGNAIRANIPDCRQTNAKFFPDYEFREYPKQMLDASGAPIVSDPIYLMTTPPMNSSAEPQKVMRKGPDGVPRPIMVGGNVATVYDPDEEAEFMRDHPEAQAVSIPQPKEVNRPAPAGQRLGASPLSLVRPVSPELAAARAELAELEALAARKAELLAQMGDGAEPKRRGRKPRGEASAPEGETMEAGSAERQTLAEFAAGEE